MRDSSTQFRTGRRPPEKELISALRFGGFQPQPIAHQISAHPEQTSRTGNSTLRQVALLTHTPAHGWRRYLVHLDPTDFIEGHARAILAFAEAFHPPLAADIYRIRGWRTPESYLYIPGGAGALGIFLMRQYIGSGIPRELIDAARMDGCGEFRIFWSVVLPLAGPALGTLGLITFINSWNNFIAPLVVMRSAENYTLPLALRSMQSPNNTEWGTLMVGSAIAMLPQLVAFIFSARRLVAGLTAGAVRG